MADQPKTGEGDNAKGNTDKGNTEKRTDTQRTLDALKNCFSDQDLIVSETYPFIILFIIFYFTTNHANTLITNSRNIPCQKNIKRGEYDDFISGFVYWVISFCTLIFIKFNGINFMNKFVIPTSKGNDFVEKTVEGGKKFIKELLPMGRAKYVFQTLLSITTSFLNIYFVIILLYTLYGIIDKTIELVECKSEVCTKYNLCNDQGDPSKASYYKSDGKCYDSNFKPISELDSKSNNDSNAPKLEGSESNNGNKGRLVEDFVPSWIGNFVKSNNLGSWRFWVNMGCIVVMLGIYIWEGTNSKLFSYVSLFSVLIILISTISSFFGDNMCEDVGCNNDNDCKKNLECEESNKTKCESGKCRKQAN